MMSKGPLLGLKVLDFSTLLPGPYATLMLADMGAEVLKVSKSVNSDLLNKIPPFLSNEISAIFGYLNRGKTLINLNLKQKDAIKIVRSLVKETDVLVEQFRPGVLAKFGLGYKNLKKINSRLVYCSITGYGQTGVMASKAGHDINFLARSGIISCSGEKGKKPPLMSTQFADLVGAQNAVIGILASLLVREKEGYGQFLDISMTDGAFMLNVLLGANFLAGGVLPEAGGTFLTGSSFYDYYETLDHGWISVACLETKFLKKFCSVIGIEQHSDIFSLLNDANFKKEVKEAIAQKKLKDWEAIFEKLDVCVEPVLDLKQAYESDYARDRKMVVNIKMEGGEKVLIQPGFSIKFSETPVNVETNNILTNKDSTTSVLTKLGYTRKELKRLEKKGTFS